MSRICATLLTLFFGLVCLAPVDGQDKKLSWELGFNSIDPQATIPDHPFFFGDDYSSGIRLGFNKELTDWWDVNLGLTNGFRSLYASEPVSLVKVYSGSLDARLLLKLANGRWIKQNAMFQPYLGLGYNYNFLALKESRNKELGTYMASEWIIGLKTRINERFYVSVEIAADNEIGTEYLGRAVRTRAHLGYVIGKAWKDAEVEKINASVVEKLEKQVDSLQDEIIAIQTEYDREIINLVGKSKTSDANMKLLRDSIRDLKLELETKSREPLTKTSNIPEAETVVTDSGDYNEGSSIPTKGYFVVISSSQDLNISEQQVEKLKPKYPNITVLHSEKGYHRVAIYAGKNRQQAINRQKELRTDGYLMAWILFED